MRDTELGPFLRSRREATAPTDVGLAAGSRRRTPGLRRAELATLAGISVDYLVRLEQGRDRRPSAQVLAALADALRLGEGDRALLRRLAAGTFSRELCPRNPAPARTLRPAARAILERFEPDPAFVANRLTDLLAWTTGYERVVGPLGVLEGDPPNLLRFTFADRRAREVYPDWEAVADAQVAAMQASCGAEDPPVDRLVDELVAVAGPAFAERWSVHMAGSAPLSGTLRMRHPVAGELRLAPEVLLLPDAEEQRLVVLLPADAAASTALDRLAGRHPGGLHAVAGG